MVQPLLDPMVIELTPEQMILAENVAPTVEGFGFQMEVFGEGHWLVRAIPAMVRQASIFGLFQELLNPSRDPTLANSSTHYALAASVACHSAVRAGQVLSSEEMVTLNESLIGTRNPYHCPHGRPTIVHFSNQMLEREFGRR